MAVTPILSRSRNSHHGLKIPVDSHAGGWKGTTWTRLTGWMLADLENDMNGYASESLAVERNGRIHAAVNGVPKWRG